MDSTKASDWLVSKATYNQFNSSPLFQTDIETFGQGRHNGLIAANQKPVATLK